MFFIFCCYGWLLFRAHSFDQIKTFTALLFGSSGLAIRHLQANDRGIRRHPFIEHARILRLPGGDPPKLQRWRPALQGLLYATLIFLLIMGTSNAPVQFIYFQF